jgi:hypothetical protein
MEMLLLDVLFDEAKAMLYIFLLKSPDLFSPGPYTTYGHEAGRGIR